MTTQSALIAIALAAVCTSALAKTDSTIYTPQRVANARRNIERYDWAKKIRDDAVRNADRYANQSDDFLWELITPQSIPRGIEVNMKMGCPKCGKAIAKFGNYPWKVDVFNKSWKIECPSCGEVFPKNDFGKFYESGKDKNGVFHYDKADRSLLYNTDHPDSKDPLHTYGVDDTMGWDDGKGNVYRMVGYYGHYGTWATAKEALSCFRDAYVYTGNPDYARKAAFMLYRVAEFYPEMDYSYWARRGFFNSDGGSGLGKIYGNIWEPDITNVLASAYDAVYPALDDPQLLAELSKREGKPVTSADLKGLIEKNILYQIHDGILSGAIQGNEGIYQNAMTNAAVVLDDPAVTGKWLDWIFADGDARHGTRSGGNMLRIFRDKVDDDGFGDEASPGYNSIWRTLFGQVSQTLQIYGKYKNHSFVDIPSYKKMFEAPLRLACNGRFVPHIGDTSSTGSPGLSGTSLADTLYAYSTWGDPKFAQWAYFLNGSKVDGIRGDIFDAQPEAIAGRIKFEIEKHGPYVFRTDNMSSYGCALLRSGEGDNQRTLSLYYGRNTGHGHKDTLNIELFGYGMDLMPDLGYPEFATKWAPRFEWTKNTISHNTVVVDRVKQSDSTLGKANFVVDGRMGVQVAEVGASAVYPQTSLYQRTVAMVDLSPSDFYVVDIFRVKGGKEHMYSLHGPEGAVETEGLELVDQAKGTLAGENVEPYADLGFGKESWEKATGYQYLYDVRRDKHPDAQPSVTYKVVDTWHCLREPKDVRLRFNLISPPGEVILAHGDPPRNKPGNPSKLQYVLLPNDSGNSTFVTVIEPYVGARSIRKIERKDEGDTVTLKITTASGRVDTIVSATKPIKGKIDGVSFSGVKFEAICNDNGAVKAMEAK